VQPRPVPSPSSSSTAVARGSRVSTAADSSSNQISIGHGACASAIRS
jgi:hypothetical protein